MANRGIFSMFTIEEEAQLEKDLDRLGEGVTQLKRGIKAHLHPIIQALQNIFDRITGRQQQEQKILSISTDEKGDTYIKRKNIFGRTHNVKLQQEGYITNSEEMPCKIMTDGKTRYFLPIQTYGTQAERDHMTLQRLEGQNEQLARELSDLKISHTTLPPEQIARRHNTRMYNLTAEPPAAPKKSYDELRKEAMENHQKKAHKKQHKKHHLEHAH
jgi:hypothetical protein